MPLYDDLSSFSGDTEFDTTVEGVIPANFFQFQEQGTKIFIPNKTQRVVERYIPAETLRKIDPDPDVAREMCLMVLSNLSNAYYTNTNTDGWKRLKAEFLRDQVSDCRASTYRRVLDALVVGSKHGSIIEEDRSYCPGVYSRSYRLSDGYRNKGITKYELTTERAKVLRTAAFHKSHARALKNELARMVMVGYGRMVLATGDEVLTGGKKAASEGFITKKGTILTFQGKKPRSYWANPEGRAWVEEQVELYRRLTEGGLALPQVCGVAGGGRVYDSVTMMPAWARMMIKMDGKAVREFDFSCLHPNLASRLFGGTGEMITHQAIADHLGIELQAAKIANLSFFNSPYEMMKSSVLWPYYSDRESNLIENLLRHRADSGLSKADQHKITSSAMFTLEVELMTKTMLSLEKQNIHPLYVYDALLDHDGHAQAIISAMNQTAREMGINTNAK